ncbi:MAG: SIS domain-containing protein [Anaerolineaceae bacterium]|nr:SIS domain-containing protein [Anaerolineaceae bacterium]
MMNERLKTYSQISNLLQRYPDLIACEDSIRRAAQAMIETYETGNKILICGNGGSAADSEHIVGELMKGFLSMRPAPEEVEAKLSEIDPGSAAYIARNLQGALPAISLVSQSALISAFSNDVAADLVFAQQVYGYGQPGDLLIGLSTSGNANNVVYAVNVAKVLGMTTLSLTGSKDSRLSALCDICIQAPFTETLAVQERHLAIYHHLCAKVEDHFFG